MNKHLAVLIFLFPLIISCAPKDITLEDELKQMTPPYWYVVEQRAINTGYDGVPETGEYEETIEFSVLKEVIEDDRETIKPLLTMTAMGVWARQYSDKVDSQKPGRDVRCYYYEQLNVEQVTICFYGDTLKSVEHIKMMGNHQREIFSWRLMPKQ